MKPCSVNFLSYESAIAGYLNAGLNVRFQEGYVTFNDRILQLRCASNFKQSKDVLVLGSSTTLQIRQHHFIGQSIFNHSLRRGVLEDIIAVYQIHRALGFKPKFVIIGVDSWIFDPNHWKSYWPSLFKQFFRITSDWNINLRQDEYWHTAANRWRSILHAPLEKAFWKSLVSLGSRYTSTPRFSPTCDDFTDDYTKRADGSVGYHLSFRGASADEISAKIRGSIALPRFHVSRLYQQALETFTCRLLDEGVRVAFFVPPHHPAVFELYSGNTQGNPVGGLVDYIANLEQVETFVRTELGGRGATVLGSFRPSNFDLGSDDFYDWIHPKEGLVDRLLESIRS